VKLSLCSKKTRKKKKTMHVWFWNDMRPKQKELYLLRELKINRNQHNIPQSQHVLDYYISSVLRMTFIFPVKRFWVHSMTHMSHGLDRI